MLQAHQPNLPGLLRHPRGNHLYRTTQNREHDNAKNPNREETDMSELVKLNSGDKLAEGDLRTLVASLAQHLQSAAVKNADDVTCEVDFAVDGMGSRGRLRFRSYRRPPAA